MNNKIAEDIKNNSFSRAYLICGKEEYLAVLWKQRLLSSLDANENNMNYTLYDNVEVDANEVIGLCETIPFLSPKRIILLNEVKFINPEGVEPLLKYLDNEPDYLILIFFYSSVDKRGKLYKKLKKENLVIEFDKIDDNNLDRWIMSKLKKEKKNITRSTLDYFISIVGKDMYNIENELNKLLAFMGDKEVVEVNDINEICSQIIENKIFEMISNVSNKNRANAIKLYKDLLILKEPPIKILSLLGGEYTKILKVKELNMDNVNQGEIAKILGLRDFVVKKYLNYSRIYKMEELKNIIEKIVETDEAIKTGKIKDSIGVELLIIELSL